MATLESIWKPKSVTSCTLHSLEERNGDILAKVFIDKEINESLIKELLLIGRESGEEFAFPLHKGKSGDHFLNLFEAVLDLNSRVIDFGIDIWDGYVSIQSQRGMLKKHRLKNKLNTLEDLIFTLNKVRKTIIPYTTVKGNVSFKTNQISTLTKIDRAYLDANGSLTILGYTYDPFRPQGELLDLKQTIIIRSGENEYEKRFIAKFFNRAHLGSDLSQDEIIGFEAELDLTQLDYQMIEDGNLELFMEMEYKHTHQKFIKKIPFHIDSSTAIFNEALVVVDSSEGKKRLSLKRDLDLESIYLSVTNHSLQVEVNTIFADQGKIQLNGELVYGQDHNLSFDGQHLLTIKKRHVNTVHQLPIQIKESAFSCELDLADMVKREIIRDGIWDLYLRIDGKDHRLKTKMDGVPNKQKLIIFPQQIVTNSKNSVLAVKPYYTVQDHVSILIRNFIYPKIIQQIKVTNEQMTVLGKINIMIPNDNIPNQIKGKLVIRCEFGELINLPVNWYLRKTNKTPVEFEFQADTETKGEQFGVIKELLLKNINFDSVKCEIELDDCKSQFNINLNPEKIELTLEDKLVKKARVNRILKKSKNIFYGFLNKIVPMNSKTYIFQSYYGNSYACNPKAIYEELLKQNKKVNAVWVMKDLKKTIPGNPKIVKPRSFKYYYYMAVAKYFVNNGNFPDFYKKRSGAIHVQTWHGTPLKRLGYDVDPDSISYSENTSINLMNRVKRWDYLVAPNSYTANILTRAYNFQKTVLEVGYPRNDIFYQEDKDLKIREIKKKLNIPRDKKVILYAPTWRDTEHKSGKKHEPYEFRFDFENFKEKFGDEYVLLLRLHYFDAARIQTFGYDDLVYNATYYDDIKDLYLISNILVTDYSSVMFDFANLNRPIIFFTYDLFIYESKMRGFYFDFKNDAPGPLVTNEEMLYEAIENIDLLKVEYSEKYQAFREKFCNLDDGSASKRAINAVFRKNGIGERK
ncbi:CDP-glycerol glycerophosphotransferase [Scopulibacillus darangshiensis]|uniref:CDP-glycerol glycerophosphotransferase n=1 Tax=Scopulibacillus darangshiensis TaxID=442528 RepID=A0A4V2SK13_9BACL|nr:CDP-glycerol glycerophosphotransferase family protein [Scopulibacillus darangshiensis]TCP17656.1 CDP-glycerol glycerophosphotransferase [Scopulibacillus darangshiensis]